MARLRVRGSLREAVFERARECCEYCRAQLGYATEPFSSDHILPVVADGTNAFDNLAMSCYNCNSDKGKKTHAIDPETGQTVALFHPRKQVWEEHFAWDGTFTTLIGLTSTGRATISALNMNRQQSINYRGVLVIAKKHPPKQFENRED